MDLWDLEVIVIDQIKTLPVFFEDSKVLTDVIIFFSSHMPKVLDDVNSSLLAFVLIDGLKVFLGCVRRRTMLNVNKRFICYILSNEMLSVIPFPVVMSN